MKRRNSFLTSLLFIGFLSLFNGSLKAVQISSQKPWSVRMVESEMARIPESWQLDFQKSLKWDYCLGLELQTMLDVYDRYGDDRIYKYALAYADTMVNNDGSIKKYKLTDYSLDRVNSGKFLFRIYEQTKNDKYKKALDLLRSQFRTHPRNADGGFWHKKVYPNQVWLDGIYMGAPFYAEYAFRNNEVNDYKDIINQFLMAARHTYDPKTDLFKHACDVSRKERWSDPVTGQSKHSWGRAMGWYAMAFVDALDFIPRHEAGRDSMLTIFKHLAGMIKRTQDAGTGLWYQVLDKSGAEGNYLESSCSTMFVYALFKGVRKGYLDASYLDIALKGYQGILDHFIEVDKNGLVSITKACAVAGLGGKVYRSGDYQYYIHETIRSNDPKAVAPFILCSLEKERLQEVKHILNPTAISPAMVSEEKRSITVAANGSGDFKTIGEAIEHLRALMDYKVTVFIKNGTYKEKLVIPSWLKNVEFVGESAENTIITFNDHANINQMGTFRSYTVRVDANDITFRNLTIENNAPRLGQAVALHTQGDRLRFINCRFLGNQDTIYTGGEGMRLYFNGCYIEGTTDFIFGSATALFENCRIHSKINSYITAASTPENIPVGYVFKDCTLTADPAVTKVYLGRPWRPYASVIFIDCNMGKHIRPEGWHNWGKTSNETTARYSEYRCTGEGADTKGRVKWEKKLSRKEIKKYTDPNYIFHRKDSWNPKAN